MSLIQDIFSTRDAFISITYLIYHNFILVKQQLRDKNSSQVAATAYACYSSINQSLDMKQNGWMETC